MCVTSFEFFMTVRFRYRFAATDIGLLLVGHDFNESGIRIFMVKKKIMTVRTINRVVRF